MRSNWMRVASFLLAVSAVSVCSAPASATTICQQDLSAYPSGTYLSATGWTMAASSSAGTGQIQITNGSGFAPGKAITGSTAGGRGGYVAAYRDFTGSVPSGSDLVLTADLYLRPAIESASIGFWDGTVQGGGNGDPHGIILGVGSSRSSFYIGQDSDNESHSGADFGPPVIEGIYAVALHLDASSETAWASVVAPGGQSYTSPAFALTGTFVADMTGVELYVKNFGGPMADYANISASAIPEAGSLSLLGMVASGMLSRRWRRA